MDEALHRIVREALADAQAQGKDHITQTGLAVRAVREARPDMTTSDSLAFVTMVRRMLN